MADNMYAPKTLDAVIYHRGLGVVCGHARDITMDGMIVDAGPVILSSDSPMEVALVVPDAHNTLCHVQAIIAGETRDGMELRFHNLTASMRHSLKKVVNGMYEPRSAILRDDLLHEETQAA